MPAPAVSLVLVADEPASRRAAEVVFPGVERHFLTRFELRSQVPFAGPLFAVLGAQSRGACVGLVVPAVLLAAPGGRSAPGPGTRDSCELLAVADHVNLELRGPLSGAWPAGVPRTFPSMTGIYQPAVVRAFGGARVYSSGVVVAGVADAGRLTSFEAGAVRGEGICAASDTLAPAVIVAAYYDLTLAACAVPQASERERE
jgi:hypothetical protein